MKQVDLSIRLAAAFKQACLAELGSLKPGNVHVFADGHGMVVQDFIKSADAASAVIAAHDLKVGQRIFKSVDATWQAVGCNTNLGIILLAAPLIQAAINISSPYSTSSLQQSLSQVLKDLTVEDAALTYQAIQRASPAGLGSSDQHDVNAPATDTLLAGMQQAQARDMIAQQYANGYQEIFAFGVQRYQQVLALWGRPGWAITSLYLGFFAHFDDSHIARKLGETTAKLIKEEAGAHDKALLASDNPKLYQRKLMDFDASLKARGINPGTSADLTVATLLVLQLVDPDIQIM